jgi:phenylacetate-CoA ligase
VGTPARHADGAPVNTLRREEFYARLPIPLQNAACTMEGWRVRRNRYGGGFPSILREAEERLRWPHERLLAFRDDRLRRLLRHCAGSVPYYRRLFRSIGFDPAAVRSLADLAGLPVLDKTTVQDNIAELQSTEVPAGKRVDVKTSGTTGAGLHFTTTREALHEQWAVWWRCWRRRGITQSVRCGYFGGRTIVPLGQRDAPYWRVNRAGRQILFSAYHLSPHTLPDYVRALREHRPPWLHGYPSVLALLSHLMVEQRLSLPYVPSWITTGAENLLPHQSAVIETALGARPVQHYGMAEAVANFSQCQRGRLHVDEDFAAVEFLPRSDGTGYRVVGTNLSNASTPLVRYDAGDMVASVEERCECGLSGRAVVAVDGRQEDYVVLRNGARLGRMDHIFKDMTAVRQAQIVQDRPGTIVTRIVRSPTYGPADEAGLREAFFHRLGDEAEVRFEYVDDLPRTAGGKLRFVVSSLREGRLQSD